MWCRAADSKHTAREQFGEMFICLCTEVKIRKTDEIINLYKYSNKTYIYIYPDQTKMKTEGAEQLSAKTDV